MLRARPVLMEATLKQYGKQKFVLGSLAANFIAKKLFLPDLNQYRTKNNHVYTYISHSRHSNRYFTKITVKINQQKSWLILDIKLSK